ncbi:hypothetical protein [Thalassiella azotivora]
MSTQPPEDDAPAEPVGAPEAAVDPLVAAACAKAGLVWVRTGDGRARPLWHVWHQDAVTVVVGVGEQHDVLPPHGATVTVEVPSKDTRARLVVFEAVVEQVLAGGAGWEEAVFALRGGRLNAPDAEHLVDRWAASCRVVRLVPVGAPTQGPGGYDDSAGTRVPAPTPATTVTWRPFHAGGRRRSRRRPR